MLNLVQVGSVLCVVSLVLAFNGGVADAGLSTNCVATDGSTPSLLLQVKKKKKHQDGDDDSSGQSQKGDDGDAGELTECTIQQPGGGGGCKTGFKRQCETLESGKKCCGCVPDKNAEPDKKAGGDQPQALAVFACTSDVETLDGRIISNRKAGIRAANDTEARIIYMTSLPQGVPLRGPVTCTLNPGP
jgi:hypothetical protein